ncbi:hypothetical protein LMG16407_00511 [Pandoraea apista]|nr:hypothetical protein LMG16407_00511 [Pandoraea apista]
MVNHVQTVRAAMVDCGRSIALGVAGAILLVALALKGGSVFGWVWYGWHELLTGGYSTAWPAILMVWASSLGAVWSGCVATKLTGVWQSRFAISCMLLVLVVALPANCAVWAMLDSLGRDNIQAKLAAMTAVTFPVGLLGACMMGFVTAVVPLMTADE